MDWGKYLTISIILQFACWHIKDCPLPPCLFASCGTQSDCLVPFRDVRGLQGGGCWCFWGRADMGCMLYWCMWYGKHNSSHEWLLSSILLGFGFTQSQSCCPVQSSKESRHSCSEVWTSRSRSVYKCRHNPPSWEGILFEEVMGPETRGVQEALWSTRDTLGTMQAQSNIHQWLTK